MLEAQRQHATRGDAATRACRTSIPPPNPIRFTRAICGDLAQAERREWWIANGLGGYAGGTIAGSLTRRYHGLLIAPIGSPLGRRLLLAKADATVIADAQSWPLFTNRWKSGAVAPAGHVRNASFHLDYSVPVWTYEVGDQAIEARIWMEPGAHTTYAAWRLRPSPNSPDAELSLRITLLVNGRDHHATMPAGGFAPEINADRERLRIVEPGAFTLTICAPGAAIVPKHDWYRDFDLPIEAERDLDSVDNHLCAGELMLPLVPGQWCGIVASLDPEPSTDVEAALGRRLDHDRSVVSTAFPGPAAQAAPPWIVRLALAADAFVFARPLAGVPDGKSVIAGYPWFGDWGRDTMISLPGLTLATGRPEIARRILQTFASFVSQGMLPNVFPGAGDVPQYNTADASLWFFEAWRAYIDATGNLAALREAFPILSDMVEWHRKGTRYGIGVDGADGLLRAGVPGSQLTWMDAKVGDWAVTPRIGKPVEINALWYNALRIMSAFAARLGEADRFSAPADAVRQSFARFRRADGEGLYDVVDGPDGNDASIRPNQIFAASLSHSPLSTADQANVVRVCRRQLLTAFGLRSLAPGSVAYHPHEDYSPGGTAWDYFTHDQARSRAYRRGEDGLAGFSDSRQLLCVSLALWNGRDPILKERLFGLTNGQGNHGEDVKELYYYLDAVPSYAYARMLYKLSQAAYPYQWLIDENARRRASPAAMEFELIDTGIFNEDRYFDIEVEYAKADVDDVLMRVTIHNRGPEQASIHVLPQVWFRNTWSWSPGVKKPALQDRGQGLLLASHDELGAYSIAFDGADRLLFCENESNFARLFGVGPTQGYFKDAFHEYVVHGRADTVSAVGPGTKAAGFYLRTIPAAGSTTIRVRLRAGEQHGDAFLGLDDVFTQRIAEADAFYSSLQKDIADEDMHRIQRQAFAGMLWNKQFYDFNVREWLDGDPLQPPPPESRKHGRNSDWVHFRAGDIISMPDKWEYPWFAAWDLAFHCVTLSLIDPDFAKQQLLLLCEVRLMHPNGQLPAYEWAFGDVNPPVHAWAAMRVFENDRNQRGGTGDLDFLERVFLKLLLNFTWWVNRKDPQGLNIFEGGFLGLDNIGVFDRSRPLPTGGTIEQSDGTAWMAMFCLNMLRMTMELSRRDPVYEDMAIKFLDHFLHIAGAMTDIGKTGIGLWKDDDNFFYDVLSMPSGSEIPLRLRSMVGLIPLFAVGIVEQVVIDELPELWRKFEYYRALRPDLVQLVSRWYQQGVKGRRLVALVRVFRMIKLLHRMLDESEFLSPYGVRALSRAYLAQPYDFEYNGVHYRVHYEPGESESGLFGGNSNWRGPIWMPVNYLLIENLRRFYLFYGDGLKIECPTGSGDMLTLDQIADELCHRLINLFRRGADGRRPVFGAYEKFQTDPHFKDYILFHEYFHGDNGRGCGASHQSGWTGLVANLIAQIAQRPPPAPAASGEPASPRRHT